VSLSLAVPALLTINLPEILVQCGNVKVINAEGLLTNREGVLEECLGFRVSSQLLVEVGEAARQVGYLDMIRAWRVSVIASARLISGSAPAKQSWA
jgi:hypothetical protein